jgi:hypothetical protein
LAVDLKFDSVRDRFPVTPAARATARRALWDRRSEDHVAPLVQFADALGAERGLPSGTVPYVDPDGGGVHSRVLFLLNDPGDGAQSGTGGSGMLTMLNEDQTSRKQRAAVEASGLERSVAMHWNAVPWPVPKGTAPKHVSAGGRSLVRLVELLPDLRGILALGATARLVTDEVQVISSRVRGLEFNHSAHPERPSNAALFDAYRWAAAIATD